MGWLYQSSTNCGTPWYRSRAASSSSRLTRDDLSVLSTMPAVPETVTTEQNRWGYRATRCTARRAPMEYPTNVAPAQPDDVTSSAKASAVASIENAPAIAP